MKKETFILPGIFLLACVVRFYGITFGLPQTNCRPDEETIIFVALKFFSGDLDPHFFNYPTLYMYLLFGIYCFYLLIRMALGGTIAEFLAEIAFRPNMFYLLSRSLSALLGACTTLIVYLIARRISDKNTALISSIFMSITYLHVRNSHFGTTDVTMTFFIACAILYILKASEDKKKRDYIIAGIFTGLATATKYGGIFLVLPMFLAHISLSGYLTKLHKKTSALVIFKQVLKEQNLWFYSGAAVISFFLLSPFILLDFTTFIKDFLYEMHHVSNVQGVIATRGWWYHLRYTLPYGMGWGIFLASLAGIALHVRKDHHKAIPFYTFPVIFFLVAGKGYTVHLRYMIPVLPFLCIAAAICVSHINTIFTRSFLRKNLLPLWILLLAFPSFYNVIVFNRLIAKADNRVIAADWIHNNLPAGSSIYRAGSLYGQVQLRLSKRALEEQYQEVVANGGTGRFIRIKLQLLQENGDQKGFYDWKYDENVPISERADFPDFIVIQRSPLIAYSKIPSQIMELVETQYHLIKSFEAIKMDSSHHWYNQLDAFYLPFVGFKKVSRPGPNLYIYKPNTNL